jgi:hypothetical protein
MLHHVVYILTGGLYKMQYYLNVLQAVQFYQQAKFRYRVHDTPSRDLNLRHERIPQGHSSVYC